MGILSRFEKMICSTNAFKHLPYGANPMYIELACMCVCSGLCFAHIKDLLDCQDAYRLLRQLLYTFGNAGPRCHPNP